MPAWIRRKSCRQHPVNMLRSFPKDYLQQGDTVSAIKLFRLTAAAAMERIEESEKAKAAASFIRADDPITVHVKFSGRKISVTLSPESTILDLKSRLHSLTDVLTRCQKLIFKGKIHADVVSLRSVQITDGSKLMMIATLDQHIEDEPSTKDGEDYLSIGGSFTRTQKVAIARAMTISRRKRWKKSGVANWSGRALKALPDDVWDCAPFLIKMEFSSNSIEELPNKIGILKSLNLYLNDNHLCDEKFSWDGLSQLKSLTVLSLNTNRLTTLSPSLGELTSLSELDISMNKITCLPDELGCLNRLQILKARSNRISSVPASIGNCSLLNEVDLSANILTELPETFGQLRNLKVLHLRLNNLKTLPSTLFKFCQKLSVLSFFGTQITNDYLRQAEGWQAFDRRRRGKYVKGVDPEAGPSRAFDKGDDSEKEQ
ncbi:LRR repeats and ubiquitin-like domain-containing protein At2g30105 isoform X2 [Dendrobium catenatum]|uniref:LRR repeats and ubiquitin-like domain-containing protein At2g30105 isoform X2 n=1 Tax=Dendrobium catenatum TaxID=906689 RepID=UPI0009F3C761|nr:LRR repeats and ubiquitin-like domain-containing protein At2g30105 isoform X2 [Dendrobium catenatum]